METVKPFILPVDDLTVCALIDKAQFLTNPDHPRVKRIRGKTYSVDSRIFEQIIDPEFESLGT